MNQWIELIKTIGIIIAIILALFQISDWVSRPSPSVYATIDFGAYEYPPKLFEKIHIVAFKNQGKDKLPEAVLDSSDENLIRANDLFEIKKKLDSNESSYALLTHVPYSYRNIEGYYRLVLKNEGNQVAESVAIKLPSCKLYSIQRETGTVTKDAQNIGNPKDYREMMILNIGNMQPREEATITVWTELKPSEYTFYDVELRHSGGVGKIHVRVPDGNIMEILARRPMSLAVLAGLIMMSLAFLLSVTTPKKLPQDRAQEDATPPS